MLAFALEIGRWPEDYYEVASPALRKMDKLDPSAHRKPPHPKDHRLLSIYSQLYRIESGDWYHKHRTWMVQVMHRSCGGAMPGRHCLEVSWDTRAELAYSIEQAEEEVLAFLDYQKIFDSFEPHFSGELLLTFGMDPGLVRLFVDLRVNATRRIKIGNTYGPPLRPFNALGQGHPLVLIVALAYVSASFLSR